MPSMAQIKSATLRLATNLRGWKTRRKLLVVESDDWGAIRMPNRKTWERLLSAGIRVDRSRYDSLDSLENRDDFQALMNVLDSHRDARGCAATMTFNTVMGNPDFDAIERDSFHHFYHERFLDSYRHYHGEDLESDWHAAAEAGLIRPQFHGREHLNVPLWMRDLEAGHRETCIAFRNGFYGLTTRTSSPRQVNYLAACWAESKADLDSTVQGVTDGLEKFRETFGYDSSTFIPCNYILPEQVEPVLRDHRVHLLQGQRGQFVPSGEDGSGHIERAFTGKRSGGGLLRSVRNVKFEPFEDTSRDWVGSALDEIQQSFALRKPAIISSHRVNYVSGMNLKHRDRNLAMLDTLLANVRRRWPDIEFLSSDQLLNEMISN